MGKYWVDFYVEDLLLGLVLECDEDNHDSYDAQKEEARNQEILRHCTLIRFNSKISPEALLNGILKAKPQQLVKLYQMEWGRGEPTRANGTFYKTKI